MGCWDPVFRELRRWGGGCGTTFPLALVGPDGNCSLTPQSPRYRANGRGAESRQGPMSLSTPVAPLPTWSQLKPSRAQAMGRNVQGEVGEVVVAAASRSTLGIKKKKKTLKTSCDFWHWVSRVQKDRQDQCVWGRQRLSETPRDLSQANSELPKPTLNTSKEKGPALDPLKIPAQKWCCRLSSRRLPRLPSQSTQ